MTNKPSTKEDQGLDRSASAKSITSGATEQKAGSTVDCGVQVPPVAQQGSDECGEGSASTRPTEAHTAEDDRAAHERAKDAAAQS